MNMESIKLKAQQVRHDYLKWRAQRNSGKAVIGVPVVVDAIAADADGLMPITALDSDIQIRIPSWSAGTPPPGFVEKLLFQWKLITEDDTRYVTLLDEEFPTDALPSFPLDKGIAKAHFEGREGGFHFRYGVKGWNDSLPVFSAPVPITLDRTAPYADQIDPTPLAIEALGPLTDADLVAGVSVIIPDFVEDKKDFVTVKLAWSNTVPPADTPVAPDVSVPLPSDRTIAIPSAVIKQFPSGDHYVAYELWDKAGNRSRVSYVRTVPVALGPPPTALKPPFVPLAPDSSDNLIDLADAHLGVVVEIPEYENSHYADQVVVKWGNTTLVGVPVGERPPFPEPIEIPVIWAHLVAEYAADPANRVTPVTYSIVRGTTLYPLPDADGIEVDVNFAYTGPDNPNDPDPVNPNLAPLSVKGPSGTVNHLAPSDANQDATATVPAPAPSAAGDIITLYWKGVAVAETKTLDGSEAPGDPLDIKVLWSEILAGQAGIVPVYYTLSNASFVNDQRSVDSDVTVDAILVNLAPAEYPDLSEVTGGNKILNCASLRQGIGGEIGYRVHIPASSYLIAGSSINLTWQLKEGGVAVPNSEKTETQVILAGADLNGIEWFVQPYDPHILLAYTGTADKWAYAETTYTLTINSIPVSSTPTPTAVGISDLGSGIDTCDLSDITPLP